MVIIWIMSLSEIEKAVEALSSEELTKLASFIRERENAAWDRQIDADFAEDGRLRPVLDEVHEDIRADRLDELP
jgi:hypothetical protein